MSSFSDTFTKNSEQEDLLNYDDSAAYYFTASVLTCIVLPWSWAWIRHFMWGATTSSFPEKTTKGSTQKYCRNGPMEANVDKIEAMAAAKEKKNKRWNVLKLIGLAFLWCALIFCCFQLADDSMGDSIKVFNPFDILEVSPGSDDATVKKAYRKMSLIYHPDKNPDDPLASAKFIQVSKAYTALTDPAAKANYEKYGNPDGPQTTKVGIGLPRFLLEKQNHLLILCSFFVILLVVIPAFFITYYQRQKHYAPNGVLVETLQFLGHYVGEQTKLKNGPELLAASAESRSMDVRPEDDEEMKPIVTAVVEHQKHMFKEPAIVVRNNYLIWAHMQRLHHLMSEDLQLELNTLLAQTNKVCSAMVEIACLREWYATAVELINFKRYLIQAMDVKSSSLMQIPHFNEETVKHCHRGNSPIKEVHQFLERNPDQRRGTNDMTEEQTLDINEWAKHMTQVKVEAKVEVEGEESICRDDIATVSIRLTREQLNEGEAVGYVHAPHFPEMKKEEWYVFLSENGKIICHEKLRSDERVVTERLRFQVGRKGKHQLEIKLYNDSYVGVDKTVKVDFEAVAPEDCKERSVYVHPEDENLDLHPTLFQQFMGELQGGEESEDEEELPEKEPKKKDAKPAPKAAGNGEGSDDSDSSSDSGSDSDSDDE